MALPYIIPFFITHQGCPHRCVFCNQKKITGMDDNYVSPEDVFAGIQERLKTPRHKKRGKAVVAFYGGSFTGLQQSRQNELLDAVQPFIDKGDISGVRVSTRPDCVDQETATFLKRKGVITVELGVQSMDDRVLEASNRGHSLADIENAVRCLQNGEIEVGVQLMVGLPGQSTASCIKSAKAAAAMKPDLIRIYPAVVLKESGLAKLYQSGVYRPLPLDRAVILCGMMVEIFDHHNIRVIRAGLQATDSLANEIIAGPYHPAFGELVLSRNLYRKVWAALKEYSRPKEAKIIIAAADQSVFRGPGNVNLERLKAKGLLDGIELIFDSLSPRGQVRLSA